MYSSMHFSPVCDPHDFDYINIQFDCIDIETHDFNVAQILVLGYPPQNNFTINSFLVQHMASKKG